MNWWRRQFGLHPVEFVLYVVAGGFVVGAVGDASHNDAIPMLVTAGWLGMYAWLRHRAIARLPTGGEMTSGEVRLAELDAQGEELHDLRGRVMELEERLDFAERLLAKSRDPEQIGRA